MAGGITAGRLDIEIVADLARLQQDMDKIRRVMRDAGADIGSTAKAANDNLRNIGKGATGNIIQFSREVARLKAEMDPAWGSLQKYRDQVRLLQQALREGALTHKQFVAEMRTAVTSYQKSGAAIRSMTDGQRAGFQQLSMNLSDVTTMYMLGARPAQIFASQIGQITQAVQLAAGGTSKFAAFLAGPWGLAIAGAVMILGPFVAKLFESGDAADDAGKAYESMASKLDMQKHSVDEVTKALREYNAEQEKSRQITLDAAAATAKKIAENIKEAISIRQTIKAMLDQEGNRALIALQASGGNILAAPYLYQQQQSQLQGKIAEQDKLLKELTEGAKNSVIDIADELAKINTDPRYAIEDRFVRLRNEAKESIKDVTVLTARLSDLNRQEKSALDALTKTKGISNSTASDLGTMKALLRELIPGVRITSDTGGRHVAGSDHYKGRALDFVPAGGMGQYSKAEMLKILEDAGVNIRRNASGVKQFFGPGDKGHSDHFHLAWDGSAPDPDKVIAAAKKAQEALRDMGERSAESIQRISERFDEQPKLIDQVEQATRDLDKIMGALAEKRPPGFEQMIEDAKRAKEVVADAINRPFREYLRDQERSAEVQSLILAGREDEAQALQTIYHLQDQVGQVTKEQREAILANVAAERQINELLAQRQAIVGAYLDSISTLRSDLEALLSGNLSGKGFLKNLKANYQQLQGKLLTEQMFGPMLRALEDQIRKSTGIQSSLDVMTGGMEKAGAGATDLATAFANARATITGGSAGAMAGAAVSDPEWDSFLRDFDAIMSPMGPDGEIVVNAAKTAAATKRAAEGVAGLKPSEYADMMAGIVTAPLAAELQKLGINLSGTLSGIVSGYTQGGVPGAVVNGLRGFMKDYGGDIFGAKLGEGIMAGLDKAMGGIQTGTMAAGLMKSLGLKTSTTGAQVGGAIGSFIPIPGGDIIGSILGGIVGGLLKKTKWARADVSGISDADTRYRSNSGKYESVVNDAAKGVIDGLKSIAEQLGGVAGEFGSIAIGVRDGKWRVNTTGTSLKTGKGAIDFGEDSAAAIAYAIQQAVKQGAISGINQSVLNLLQASGDFETQLSKAAELQNIFSEIAQSANPMGYELEQLAKKFASVNALLAEANATPEEVQQVADYQAQQEAAIRARYAAEAAAKQAAIDEKTAELLALQGKATLALNKSRAAELAQMDATTAAIQKQIYIEQDAATKRALWIELLEAQGNAEAAKLAQRDEVMRATLDENKATQQRIWLLQDLSEAYNRESEELRSTADEWKSLGDTLRGFRKELYSTSDGTLTYVQALTKLMQVGGLASTGDKTAIGNLPDAGRAYLDTAKNSARTMQDYQRSVALVAGYTDQAIAFSDSAEATAERELAAMEEMVGQFITLNETAQSVEQALEKLVAFNAASAASAAPAAPSTPATNSALSQLPGSFEAMQERMLAMQMSNSDIARLLGLLTRQFGQVMSPDGTGLIIQTAPDTPIDTVSA